MLDNRLAVLRTILHAQDLDALLITRPVNLRYLCGFTGSSGALIVTPEKTVFLTDSRYTSQARFEVTADEQREYTLYHAGVVAALLDCRAERAGFEAEHVTCAALERLRAEDPRLQWRGLDKPLLSLRSIKDESELKALEDGAHRAAAALEEIIPLLQPGVTEEKIALELEFALRRQGGDDRSFEPIVASGERGALPHGVATCRRIQSGELVTIDFGLRRNGYCSDETVTFAIGSIDAELERVYTTVYRAQQAAFSLIRPGVALKDVDSAARQIIAEAGYGEFFGHGLGHGVGMEVHEYPAVSPRSEESAECGMVFTIEPGIYIPGKGGVRLEDMVVVTADGFRRLTRLPKELQRLC